MTKLPLALALALAGCGDPEPTCVTPGAGMPHTVSCYSDRAVPIAQASDGDRTFWIPVCADEVPLEVVVIDSEAGPADPVQYLCTSGVTEDWEVFGPRVVYERVNPRCVGELVREPEPDEWPPRGEYRTVVRCEDGSEPRCAPVVCPWPVEGEG